MARIPITVYRPTQANDGEGGLTPTLGTGRATYATLTLHEKETAVIVDRCEDILPEDIIAAATEIEQVIAYYRVMYVMQPPRSRNRALQIERIERPIWPIG